MENFYGPIPESPKLPPAEEKRWAREGIEDMNSRMQRCCFEKCIGLIDSDLTKGEFSCLERCVIKYLHSQVLIKERMNDPTHLLPKR